jgi:hypothetical protein
MTGVLCTVCGTLVNCTEFLGKFILSFIGFKASKVPENLDTIIIGSGMGGLSVGVLLARAGKKVLVLEQHDQAGGCCHTFHDKGFEFDTGISNC